MSESHYRNVDIRDRMDVINERVIKAEGRQDGHESLCAERYKQILDFIAALRANIATVSKVGLLMALVLILIELGKASIPTLLSVLTKAV